MSELARVVAVAALIGANAFFVVAEYSILTARRAVLAQHAAEGSKRAATALRLMDHPVRVISTVQVGITAIGILTGAIGEPLVRDILGDGVPRLLSFLIAFAVVTYFAVVLGELVPKALTLDRAEKLALVIAPPIEAIGVLLRPVVWLLDRSAKLVLRPFGIEQVVAGQAVRTPGDLRALVDEAEHQGVIPRSQEELLHKVFDFVTLEAADAMVPAPETVWLEADASPEEALNEVIDSIHTRFPVGRGGLDHLVGVIHAREIAAAVRDGWPKKIGPLVRPAYVIPETKDLGALLREMREQREQMAVVVNEYGTTSGIVTLEDILEEIVGEIESEYELPDDSITRIDADTVRVAGSITVDDFNELQGTALPQEGPRTLSGLVFSELGRAPVPGDEVRLGDVELRVEEVEGARITSLAVRRHVEAAGDGSS